MRVRTLVMALALACVSPVQAHAADQVMSRDSGLLITQSLEGVVASTMVVPVIPYAGYEPLPGGGAVFTSKDPDKEGVWLARPSRPAVRLTSGALDDQPTISRDGTTIAFRRYDATTGSADIYSIQSDGSGLKRLTNSVGVAEYGNPRFSPDGSSIAFTCQAGQSEPNAKACGPQADGTYWYHGVLLMNADGSNERMILRAQSFSLSWSNDGQWLATVAVIPVQVGDDVWTGYQLLFVVKTDGSDLFADESRQRLVKISDDPAALVPGNTSLSPDGSRVVFLGIAPAASTEHEYIVDRDGNNLTTLPLKGLDAFFVPPATGGGPSPTVDATHIEVPAVAQLTVAAARSEETARHLNVVLVKRHSNVLRGRVITSDPRPGEVVHRPTEVRPTVTLYVSSGRKHRVRAVAVRRSSRDRLLRRVGHR